LIQDGHLIAVIEDERFSRVKHGKLALVDKADELPEQAIAFYLQSGSQTFCEALYGPLVLWAIQQAKEQAKARPSPHLALDTTMLWNGCCLVVIALLERANRLLSELGLPVGHLQRIASYINNC
jgi:hypothetical protein